MIELPMWLSDKESTSSAGNAGTGIDPWAGKISWSSLKLTSIELVMPSSHLILCHPLLLLLPIPPSIRVFSNESTLHEVAKVLEFRL